MVNQTAMHALPAAINGLSNALLASVAGPGSRITVTNSPLPIIPQELFAQVSHAAGG